MYETHDKKALLLPNVTSADAGKVLAVDENGKLSPEEIESELPALTGNAGKVLTVASGASGVEWKDVPSELPSLTGNAGKVLKVNADAEGVEWSEAGGGGGGGTFIAHLSVDAVNDTYVFTESFSDIYSELSAGHFVYAVFNDSGDCFIYYVQAYSDSYIEFACFPVYSGVGSQASTMFAEIITLNSEDGVTVTKWNVTFATN